MQLRLGERNLSLDRARVMGVLNITSDSFSDGGDYLDAKVACARAEEMCEHGADIIDVGAESTRPGATSVSVQEELDRAIPVIERIHATLDVAISIDTSKLEVMQAAVAAGAALLNDVRAFAAPGALEFVAESGVGACLMHMQGDPATMQDSPSYDDLPGDIVRFLRAQLDRCQAAGVDRDRLIIDPGFGFGKSDLHNLRILAKLDQFSELGVPLLVGLSRKRTLGNITGRAVTERQFAGAAAAAIAVLKGALVVRTHEVASTVDALRIADAVIRAGKST